MEPNMTILPEPVYDPPFRVTRASHVVLEVKDLAVSKNSYVEVMGLVGTNEDADVVYLRGIEEACHHSLVLRGSHEQLVQRIGFRVLLEKDLEEAKRYFENAGCKTSWADVAYQGQTLHVTDPQ